MKKIISLALAALMTISIPMLSASAFEEQTFAISGSTASADNGFAMVLKLLGGSEEVAGAVVDGDYAMSGVAAGSYVPARHTISRLFRMDRGREMRLTDRMKGVEIAYRAGETYGYWMVYNGGSKEYLCVEPQSWLSDCPNAPFDRDAHGFAFIEPGEACSFETVMSIREI